MIRKCQECVKEERNSMREGPGSVTVTSLCTVEELLNKGRIFSKLELKPGCGIGYHVHEKETELFYIMKGTPIYNDNGTEVQVSEGDVAICAPGQGHSITNKSDSLVQVIALIIKE
jgi:quercetin dioxygenase-like cupin family protein